jgi:outer membrane biosynthesis protein TonB
VIGSNSNNRRLIMKKIMLILAITGVLISCSSKDETVKKETTVEVVAPQEETVTSVETTEVEATEIVTVEVEKPVLTDEDYKSVSEPMKKPVKKTKPVKKAVVVEEKAAPIVVPVMETSVDEAVDTDVDKEIAKTETETKVVEVETPVEESGSNKTLFGILGAILVAAAAVFVFKKK